MKNSKRNNYLVRRFGITEEQYDDLLRKQEGRCAVCKRSAEQFKRRLALDHDHETSEVRGILCLNCNRFIVGRHRKGNGGAELLLSAYQYLTKEYPGWLVPPKVKKKKKKHALRKRRSKLG